LNKSNPNLSHSATEFTQDNNKIENLSPIHSEKALSDHPSTVKSETPMKFSNS